MFPLDWPIPRFQSLDLVNLVKDYTLGRRYILRDYYMSDDVILGFIGYLRNGNMTCLCIVMLSYTLWIVT